MLIEERRQYVLSLIKTHGRVLVDDLSRSLHLSKITIRKDLDHLEARELVTRTHGGALSRTGGALFDPTIQHKKELHHQEKVNIAKAAVGLVSEGQCVILDSGTTTTEIARQLLSFRRLTVIPQHRRGACPQQLRYHPDRWDATPQLAFGGRPARGGSAQGDPR